MKLIILLFLVKLCFAADPDPALKTYLEAIRNDPGDYSTCNMIGLWYVNHNDPGQAGEYFSRALTLNNNYYEGCFNMGLLLYHQNKVVEALPYFKRAFSISKNADIYVVLINCFIKLNNIDFASRTLEEAMKSYKDNHKLLNTAGVIELYKNNYTKAREYFSSAYKIKEDSKTRNNLAIAEYLSGNKENAKQTLKSLKKDLKLFNENFELINK
ncbi:MAG: tetratricopeptide repeat protein [bacterium]|nr:tetratricopeptide repeat protein [bacterium]